MGLRDKYSYAVQTAKRPDGCRARRKSATASSTSRARPQTQEEANKIWDAIKTIPDWKTEIVADIKATGGGASACAQLADLHGESGRHPQQDRQGTPG